MKHPNIRISPLNFRLLAIVCFITCALATFAVTTQLAKSARRTVLTGNDAKAATTALKHLRDIDQTCTINCTATVPSTGQVNESISFASTVNATGCTTAPTVQWNFGDGTATSSQANTTHGYAAAGTYTWTMTSTSATGSTSINTIAGGLGDGGANLQTPLAVAVSMARDPLGRGVYVAEVRENVSYIRFFNTSAATVTLGGQTYLSGTGRLIAGASNGDIVDNIIATSADLGNVAGLGVSPDGNLLYFTNALDRVLRVINVGTSNVTVGNLALAPGRVTTLNITPSNPFGTNLSALTVASNGDLYVCDATPLNNRVYRISPSGALTAFAGNGESTRNTDTFTPGVATNIPLLSPRALEFDDAGNLYISDTGHGRVIRIAGGNASLIAQFTADRNSAIAPFNNPPFPSGLAFQGGKLYIAMANAQVIVRMDGSQANIVSGANATSCDYSSTNCGDGGSISGGTYAFNSSTGPQPTVGFEADPSGLYLLDQGSNLRSRVRFLNTGGSSITLSGVTINSSSLDTVAGSNAVAPFDGAPATSASLTTPTGIALDNNSNLYLSDTIPGRVRFVNRSNAAVTLFAGTESAQTVQPGRIITINRDVNLGTGQLEGPVIKAAFSNPQGMFATANGVFVVDSLGGQTVRPNPQSLSGKRTGLLRFINTSASNVTFYPGTSAIVVPPGNIGTLAGGGIDLINLGNNGNALNAVFVGATDVAVANDGTIYIADTGNKAVRKINPANGVITSLPLTAGKEYTGLTIDAAGRLYITNFTDNQLLRENTAGSNTFSRMDGGGLNKPRDVVIDGEGNAYVTSSETHRIMRVAAAGGTATIFAGSTQGFSGDGGAATNAQVNITPANQVVTTGSPSSSAPMLVGIARDANGQFVFADTNNGRIRQLSASATSCTRTGQITIAGTNPVPSLASIAPNTALAGSGALPITLTGSNFVPSSVVRWNGADRPTTYVSATQLTVQIPANDITNAGTAQVTVFNPTPGGGTSSAQTFTITAPNPVPTVTSLNPTSATEGSPAFVLTVNGSGFVNGSVVRWDGSPRTTTFVSATQLTAQIQGSDLVGVGTAQVTVFNPTPGGGSSGQVAFTITATNPVPVLTSLTPVQATAGGANFTLTVTGSNFVTASRVRWNGADRPTSFISATQLTAEIAASDIASAGTAAITVFTPTPGGGVSSALNFTITAQLNPVPSITTLSPNSASVGGAAFTLSITGSNFINGSVIRWNGSNRPTTFVNGTQLTAQIPATDLANAGTAQVTVFNPTPGGGTSNTSSFSINAANNPVPVLTSLSPSSVVAGSGAFTLTINGTGFTNGSNVLWNGQGQLTSFVNATTLTIQVPANLIVNAGTAQITVNNPAPGGGTSNALSLTITQQNPTPSITNVNPASATAGGAAFTLTVNGANFVNGSIIRWNGVDRATTLVSGTQLTAQISASDIASAGTAQVTVFNPAPGGGTSNAISFSITQNNPVPTLTSLSPSSVTAGSAAFTLTLNGAGFTNLSNVLWNGQGQLTSFVNTSTLTIQVPASLVATVGTAQITVSNPSPGGGTSNALTFSITAVNNPTPVISQLNPSQTQAGSAAFILAVNGTGFINSSVVSWNGVNRQTTFISPTQLNVQILASDVANAGTAQVTVFNPSPGGGTSVGAIFTITAVNPAPRLTSLSPNSAPVGGAAFTLTLTGTGFTIASTVLWNGQGQLTNYINATTLRIDVPASYLANAGTAQISVTTPQPGGGTSNALPFTITRPNPVPTLTSLAPNTTNVGGAAFMLTVNGTNFVNGAIIRWNGANRTTTFVSATRLTAQIPATDLTTTGTAQITVLNPAPGGGASGALTFTIAQPTPAPIITSITPTLVAAGGPGFTLTVTGTGFTAASTIRWNNNSLLTNFINSTTLTASISTGEIANPGQVQITVLNPAPSGGTSNAAQLVIANRVTSVSAASFAGAQPLAPEAIVSAFGTALATDILVANSQPLPTTLLGTTVRVRDSQGTEKLAQLFFVSPGQINYLMPAGLANGTASVTVTAGNGALSFGQIQLGRVAPGMFSANASGQGLMAAAALRVKANGEQVYEEIGRFDSATNRFIPIPIDLGSPDEQVFLIAFGTGWRNRLASSTTANVTALLGDLPINVLYAGAQPDLAGLDQLNLGAIPRTLTGRGNVELAITVEGISTNKVTVSIK